VVEADKVGNYSLFLKTIYITHIDDLLMEWCDEIGNMPDVSELVFGKASVPQWTRIIPILAE